MSKSTSVKLKDGYSERLKALGETKQRSSNWLLNDAVGRYLDREEARAALLVEMKQRHDEYVRGGRLHRHPRRGGGVDGAAGGRTETRRCPNRTRNTRWRKSTGRSRASAISIGCEAFLLAEEPSSGHSAQSR